jgi:signal transduction histidine kinase
VSALLAHALDALVRETRAERGAIWACGLDGRALVLAAHGEGAAPEECELLALGALPAATDLGGEGAPECLARLAGRTGFAAAAPIGAGGEPRRLLLIGGPSDLPGAVRPRTLAALGAAAERLAAPLAAAASLSRLARLDAEVRRLDRLASLGELVAEIVHEIRNPLVSVKTFLQLLPERAGEPDFEGRFREVAAEELRRIERLLDLVLSHARPGAAVRDSDHTLLAGACESVLQLVSHRAADLGVAVELVTSGPPLRVALSDDALRQVVLNLVLNALDATPRGGRVRLVLRAAGDEVELRVEDQGPGVAPALRERVFEPFFSTKPEAPGGLGLAISRRIAEESGGALRVDDAPGGGSSFALRLPSARP